MLFAFITLSGLRAGAQTFAPTPQALASLWDREHVSAPVSALVDHAEVKRRLAVIAASGAASVLHVQQVGASVEGREIYDVSFGTGPYVVMLWSQMHGDEATATSALFDLYAYVDAHRAEPQVAGMLQALTVHTVPMLNPDGAERWQRRNAQGIDINRDALLLQSPEGQLLKKLRDTWQPSVGINLHNQNWRTSVGKPPVGAAISLLAVAFDESRTMSPGRVLTRQLASVVRDSLEPLAPGRIGKYDEAFEARAFGDNLTKWGTPVL
ncbi:MAG: peptidase M14, partial [Acidobacteria bacterium 37-65-4]